MYQLYYLLYNIICYGLELRSFYVFKEFWIIVQHINLRRRGNQEISNGKIPRKRISRGVQYEKQIGAKKYEVLLSCFQPQSLAAQQAITETTSNAEKHNISIRDQQKQR